MVSYLEVDRSSSSEGGVETKQIFGRSNTSVFLSSLPCEVRVPDPTNTPSLRASRCPTAVNRYEVRLLSDYFERAGLRGVPSNQLGMIEQVVISHGRTFTGTFYSSFSAHVFRHRLYLGKVGLVFFVLRCFRRWPKVTRSKAENVEWSWRSTWSSRARRRRQRLAARALPLDYCCAKNQLS